MAEQESATLRLLGATAVRARSETAKRMASSRPLTDLDFVTYKKDRKKIEMIFARLGYQPSQTFNMLHGDERLLFYGHDGALKVDVWLEVFSVAQTFNVHARLELDRPTLPLADLLMTKLQIVELNEKDVKDIICLLMDHDLSEDDGDRERINVTRLVEECSREWGIYKSFATNLNSVKTLASNYAPDGNASLGVVEKIDRIVNLIEAAPKSLKWKMRARVGEKRPWYETPDVR